MRITMCACAYGARQRRGSTHQCLRRRDFCEVGAPLLYRPSTHPAQSAKVKWKSTRIQQQTLLPVPQQLLAPPKHSNLKVIMGVASFVKIPVWHFLCLQSCLRMQWESISGFTGTFWRSLSCRMWAKIRWKDYSLGEHRSMVRVWNVSEHIALVNKCNFLMQFHPVLIHSQNGR